jgi:UPF0176 protein
MTELKLPVEEQRALRAGRENGIKIFNKSKGLLQTTMHIPAPEND